MGLLFTNKNPKSVPSSALGRKDILKISKGLGFAKDSTRWKFQEILSKAKSGGATREEISRGFADLVSSGLPKEKARSMAKKIGLEQERFLKFNSDSSKNRKSGEKNIEASKRESMRESSIDKKSEDKTEAAGQKNPTAPGNASSSMKLSSSYSNMQVSEKNDSQMEAPRKPGSIWDILNRRKN